MSLWTRHPARLHTAVGLAVTLALCVLGVQRGEVGRTWICFMPLIHLGTIARLDGERSARGLALLQGIGLTVIGLRWYVP